MSRPISLALHDSGIKLEFMLPNQWVGKELAIARRAEWRNSCLALRRRHVTSTIVRDRPAGARPAIEKPRARTVAVKEAIHFG